MNEEQAENYLHHENVYTNNLGGRQRPQKRARFVTYGEQVNLVRNTPRAAALGMRTVPGTWQSYPVVRSQRGVNYGPFKSPDEYYTDWPTAIAA